MRNFNHDLVDFFISDEMYKERVLVSNFGLEKELDEGESIDKEFIQAQIRNDYLKNLFNNFFYIPELKDYCDKFAKKNKLRPYALLDAHGCHENRKWNYEDKGKIYSLQNWINKKDGEYGSLLISCCNEGSLAIPKSKKSIVLFSNGNTLDTRNFDLSNGYNFEIMLPGEKEPLDPYCLEYELNRLNKRR